MSHPLTKKIGAIDHQNIDSTNFLAEGSRITFFIGGKGSGKTSTLYQLLTLKESPYRKYFKHIFLISPTASKDDKLKDLVEELVQVGQYYDTLKEEFLT